MWHFPVCSLDIYIIWSRHVLLYFLGNFLKRFLPRSAFAAAKNSSEEIAARETFVFGHLLYGVIYSASAQGGRPTDLPERTWRIPHAASSLSLFKPIYLFYTLAMREGGGLIDAAYTTDFGVMLHLIYVCICPDPPWNSDAYRASVSKYFSFVRGEGASLSICRREI